MRKILFLGLFALLSLGSPVLVKAQEAVVVAASASETDSTESFSDHVGFKVGTTTTKISDLINNDKAIQTTSFGFVYRHMFTQNWGIQVEPGYQQVGVQSTSSENKFSQNNQGYNAAQYGTLFKSYTYTSDSSYKLNQFNLPILLSYYRTFGPVFVGLQTGFALNLTLRSNFTHYSPNSSNTDSDTVLTKNVESIPNPQLFLLDFVGGLHVGANVTNKLQAGIAGRYSRCLDGIAYAYERSRYTNYFVGLVVTYKVGK